MLAVLDGVLNFNPYKMQYEYKWESTWSMF